MIPLSITSSSSGSPCSFVESLLILTQTKKRTGLHSPDSLGLAMYLNAPNDIIFVRSPFLYFYAILPLGLLSSSLESNSPRRASLKLCSFKTLSTAVLFRNSHFTFINPNAIRLSFYHQYPYFRILDAMGLNVEFIFKHYF